MRNLVFVSAVLLTLSGCATTPVSYREATPVKQSNLLAGYQKFSQQKEGWLRVIVVRDSGLPGAVQPVLLSVDGTAVAKFWSGESLELFVPPDSYIFGIETPLSGPRTEFTVLIKPGKTYAFRISLASNGFILQPSTQLQ